MVRGLVAWSQVVSVFQIFAVFLPHMLGAIETINMREHIGLSPEAYQ
jgi:hypothetical protein